MNDEYIAKMDKELFDQYGKYFGQDLPDDLPERDGFGFSIGAGWYPIIGALLEAMAMPVKRAQRDLSYAEQAFEKGQTKVTWNDDYSEKTEAPWRQEDVDAARNKLSAIQDSLPQIQQVKEKFGTLRFYASGSDNVTNALVSMAESLSTITCEQCGNRGTLRHGRWLRVLCNQHAEAMGYFEKNEE